MRATAVEHDTWRRLYQGLARSRVTQAVPEFADGLATLGIGPDRIPELADVNRKLGALTGWQGVPADGLKGPVDFFAMLARREFPVGDFIRDAADLAYTPAPDVFHDLYGHLPFFCDAAYADFNERFGRAATAVADDPARLREFERLYWFGVEFPLLETAEGRRIFGGGILSSSKECDYALSGAPEVRPFDPKVIRGTEFRIDRVQETLFALGRREDLYRSLDGY